MGIVKFEFQKQEFSFHRQRCRGNFRSDAPNSQLDFAAASAEKKPRLVAMLRRSVSELVSCRTSSRVPWRATAQVPSYLSSRSFSVHQKNDPGSGSKTQSILTKFVAGSFALGSAFLAASYLGYLDEYLPKVRPSISEFTKIQNDDKNLQVAKEIHSHDKASDSNEIIPQKSSDESDVSSAGISHRADDKEVHSELIPQEDPTVGAVDEISQAKDAGDEKSDLVEGQVLSDLAESNLPLDDAEESSSVKSPEVEDENKAVEVAPTFTSVDTNADDSNPAIAKEELPSELTEFVEEDVAEGTSLLDDYSLGNQSEEFNLLPSHKAEKDVPSSYITEDGKLILDFLQALHAAEKRQAELDAKSFAEEKRVLKGKYEKELKDARVRELMYAEREAMLEKEINKERLRAAAELKALRENLEEKLKIEIEHKEKEVEHKLSEQQDVAKAELAAAIASEKASHLEKMAEANLHINALCLAFYARSEEVLQKHSAHRFALGALALEDALAKGLPIQKEVEVLLTNLSDSGEDTLIALVLSSLPEDLQRDGTKTLPQLNQKFGALKGTLRHFSLLPPGGGGVLVHSLASIASSIKVKEADASGDGIESLINKVDNLLAQGKLVEAVDGLENGVEGTQAAEVVHDWVTQARNRAITEQALQVLQSYATSISLT